MFSSFFINSLSNQSSLVHATSSRYFVINDKKIPFSPPEKGNGELFRKHQIIFLESLGIGKNIIFRTSQCHGNSVYILQDPNISMNKVSQFKADAIVTHLPECPIMVLTADCVPIVIYDPVKHVTGVVHAGRLGTQKQILSVTIEMLSREYGSRPKDLIVGMGPAIRGCCYEVGEDCVLPFIKTDLSKSKIVKITNKKKFFLDLPEANRREGYEAGVLNKNIYANGPCTVCENQRWYSYRKEGNTGRLITMTMLRSRKLDFNQDR